MAHAPILFRSGSLHAAAASADTKRKGRQMADLLHGSNWGGNGACMFQGGFMSSKTENWSG